MVRCFRESKNIIAPPSTNTIQESRHNSAGFEAKGGEGELLGTQFLTISKYVNATHRVLRNCCKNSIIYAEVTTRASGWRDIL